MTTKVRRSVEVVEDICILFAETAGATARKFAALLDQHGALVKDGGTVYVPGPVASCELPVEFVKAVHDAGGRFVGPIGKWLNDLPKRVAAAQSANCNNGGYAYRMP